MDDCFKLLHFHLGSQITNIRHIKRALNEAARGSTSTWSSTAPGLEYLDVGGGLGVDYDGSQTNFESSVNYTLQEYANDVVYHIQSVCDDAEVPHPTIISESGRAVVAYHSVLVFNVLGVSDRGENDVPPASCPTRPSSRCTTCWTPTSDLVVRNVLESYHDAQQALDMAMNLFGGGYMPLEQRSQAENLFWAICRKIQRLTAADGIRARGAGRARRAAERDLLLQLLALPVDARQLGHQAALSHHAHPPARTSGPRTTPCWATSPAIRTARSTGSSTAAT